MPGDREITGTAIDIDTLGRLSIDTGTEVTTVSAGDITHLRPAAESDGRTPPRAWRPSSSPD
jgi:hypothetical protein